MPITDKSFPARPEDMMVDSGAKSHMTGNYHRVTNQREFIMAIKLADDSIVTATGLKSRIVQFRSHSGEVSLSLSRNIVEPNIIKIKILLSVPAPIKIEMSFLFVQVKEI